MGMPWGAEDARPGTALPEGRSGDGRSPEWDRKEPSLLILLDVEKQVGMSATRSCMRRVEEQVPNEVREVAQVSQTRKSC